MPYELVWYSEPRVILERFSDYVTLDDLTELSPSVELMLKQAPLDTPIHTLIDLTSVRIFPTNLVRIRENLSKTETRRGWIILIVPKGNALLHFIGAYAAQIRSIENRFRVVYTYDDAISILKAFEPTLNLPIPL